MKAILNEEFLKRSPAGVANRELIQIIFEFKEAVIELATSYCDFREIHKDLHNWEFALQQAFGFNEDEAYHRFWEWPGCSCPHYDNADNWGTPYKIHNQHCLVHGR